jgi:energy-coupling factor transport system permease protein
MSLIHYNPKSPLAELSVEIKLIWALGISIGILFCERTTAQLILTVSLSILGLWGGLRAKELLKFIKYALPVLLIILAFHLFYHDGAVLFRFWFLKATDAGLKSGLFNILRFINFGLVAIVMIASLSPVEFSRRLAWGFGIFKIRAFSDLALVFFIALRFVPSLVQEAGGVKMAMIARGANFDSGLLRRIRLYIKTLLPLFSKVIRQADDVASAISLKSHQGRYLTGKRPDFRPSGIFLSLLGIVISIILITI